MFAILHKNNINNRLKNEQRSRDAAAKKELIQVEYIGKSNIYYEDFPYSTCISSFFGSSIPTSLFILKMFFRSCINMQCTQLLHMDMN